MEFDVCDLARRAVVAATDGTALEVSPEEYLWLRSSFPDTPPEWDHALLASGAIALFDAIPVVVKRG